MPKCQYCGRWNFGTKILFCKHCGKPMLNESLNSVASTHNEISENIQHSNQPIDELEREPDIHLGIQNQVLKIRLLSLFYLLVFGTLEFITYYISVSSGIIFISIILVVLIINASIVRVQAHRQFLLSLGLIPLLRIVNLVVPAAEIPEIYWYIIMAIPMFAAIVAITKNSNYSFNDIGLNGKKPIIQLLIALIGIGLGIIDYGILRPESLIDTLTMQTVIVPSLILIIATGFMEEMVFRGVLQRAAYALGSWGWVYVAMVYAIIQIGDKSIYHVVYTFLIALLFGWIVKKTGSILGVSISHGLHNVGLYLIIPLNSHWFY